MVSIVDINSKHLSKMHQWEQDETFQEKLGVEKPRSYKRFTDAYHTYFRGESPRLYLKGIEVDGELTGRIELFLEEGHGYIGMIVAERQRERIGSKALELFLEDIKVNKRVNKVIAEVYEDNTGSLNFFRKNGFTPTGEVKDELYRGSPRRLIVLGKDL